MENSASMSEVSNRRVLFGLLLILWVIIFSLGNLKWLLISAQIQMVPALLVGEPFSVHGHHHSSLPWQLLPFPSPLWSIKTRDFWFCSETCSARGCSWVTGWICLQLELGGSFCWGFIDLKPVQTWVTVQKCHTEILTCNLTMRWGVSSVANNPGASSFGRSPDELRKGRGGPSGAGSWALAGSAAPALGRAALPPPDSRAPCTELRQGTAWDNAQSQSVHLLLEFLQHRSDVHTCTTPRPSLHHPCAIPASTHSTAWAPGASSPSRASRAEQAGSAGWVPQGTGQYTVPHGQDTSVTQENPALACSHQPDEV